MRSPLILAHIRGRRHGIEHPIQMTVGTTDGEAIWVFRYSSEQASRTLFFSSAVQGLRRLYPDNPVIQSVSDDTRLVVSEPLGDLPGVWNQVPESTCGVVQKGYDSLQPFGRWRPVVAATAVGGTQGRCGGSPGSSCPGEASARGPGDDRLIGEAHRRRAGGGRWTVRQGADALTWIAR